MAVAGEVLGSSRGQLLLGGLVRSLGNWVFATSAAKAHAGGRKTPPIVSQIILLSDGAHNTGSDPEPIAAALKARGICIEVIGVAGHHGADELDEDRLRRLASPDAEGSPAIASSPMPSSWRRSSNRCHDTCGRSEPGK